MTEEPMLTRTFEVTDMEADGRNLEILCVPFNSPAQVADPPYFTPYMEEFIPGAFERSTKAPNRVFLDFEHQLGMGGLLGHGVALEERPQGLYGRFRVTQHPDGDKALALIEDGVLTGASIDFRALKTRKTPGGVMQRLRAHLDRVSLCRPALSAYQAAGVLSVRTAQEIELPELPGFDPELAERLEKMGLAVPEILTVGTQDPEPQEAST